jgi:energy-coupling factor transporter ATP-binding protein EcfA2
VVLLDEPFAGLDRAGAGRLAERLGGVKVNGRSAVLVTHDLARAAQLADEALVLVAGRVAFRARGGDLEPRALERAYLGALEGRGSA